MRAWLIAMLLLAACDGDDPGVDAMPGCDGMGDIDATLEFDAAAGCPAQLPAGGDSCPWQAQSCSYPTDTGPTATCTCTASGWRCSDCPADFMAPDATCEIGTHCHYEDWEHGCDCTCSDQGSWDCTPETVGSTCS
jgi:hypothetical protein